MMFGRQSAGIRQYWRLSTYWTKPWLVGYQNNALKTLVKEVVTTL